MNLDYKSRLAGERNGKLQNTTDALIIVVIADATTRLGIIDTMITKSKFKDFFNKNVAAL